MTKKSKKLGVKTNKTTVFDEADEVSSSETGQNIEITLQKEVSSENVKQFSKVCSILDHLYFDLLFLMRKTMQDKLKIEKSMTDGELNLSKSRYIMGHKNVSKLQLPTELSSDIYPSLTLEETEESTMFGKPHLNLITQEFTKSKSDDENAINIQDPTNWFGLLTPRNLKLAQINYKEAISWAVDCANTQVKINQICIKIKQITQYKEDLLKPVKNEE